MKWKRGPVSADIEDRRGMRMTRIGGGVGGGAIIVLILSLIFGQDLTGVLGTGAEPGTATDPTAEQVPINETPEERERVAFVSFVLDSAQNYWQRAFAASGQDHQRARLVLFRDATGTACGYGQSASGPFYCPADQKVYIDLSFFDDLDQRFGAPGDFAQAYVLAHEIGHHVQTLLGVARHVRELQQSNPRVANQAQVRMELQADCLAGMFGNDMAAMGILERGDIDEGLGAASAVGDDRIQRQTQGHVNPDAFTHGSAAQRAEWFRRGLQSGDMRACDTFGSR
ncbi:MAG: KPN_02809 family neutral zinc metallopeptidase [Gemmatimonadaceae bacterium]